MKIITKAKPVKIRIKSGGEEHSSLESLKKNFSVEDIVPLLDGRLERWLRQQGNDQIADAVRIFAEIGIDTDESLFRFIKCFFNEELQGADVSIPIEIAKYWSKIPFYRRNGELLYEYLLPRNLEAAKYCYNNKLLQEVDWFGVFSNFESEADGEVLYILGILLINGDYVEADEGRGMSYVEKAAKCKFEKAIQYLIDYKIRGDNVTGKPSESGNSQETEDCQKIENRFNWVNVSKMKDLVPKVWRNKDISSYMISMNQKEEKIINFVRLCREILNNSAVLPWEDVLAFAVERFAPKTITPADMFYNEKLFIIGLIYKNCKQWENAKAIFERSRVYPPSQSFLQEVNDDIRRMHFPQQIEYVVNHLFDYE